MLEIKIKELDKKLEEEGIKPDAEQNTTNKDKNKKVRQ